MRSVATGIIIATPICALGYLFVPWYHDYLISGWHSPSTWIIGIPVGIAVAILTD